MGKIGEVGEMGKTLLRGGAKQACPERSEGTKQSRNKSVILVTLHPWGVKNVQLMKNIFDLYYPVRDLMWVERQLLRLWRAFRYAIFILRTYKARYLGITSLLPTFSLFRHFDRFDRLTDHKLSASLRSVTVRQAH